MRTVAIVQARMDSERLPGKALETIGDRSILGWVIYRAGRVGGVDEVVVATTDRPEDDPIVEAAKTAGARYFRGASDDVLARYMDAATLFLATHILRVTADCPLLCPVLNSRIVGALHTTDSEYVSMTTRSNGLVQEAFTREALIRASVSAEGAGDREHVVPAIMRNDKTLFLRPHSDLGGGRYCVDTPEDLERLRGLYRSNMDLFALSGEEIVRLDAHEFSTR